MLAQLHIKNIGIIDDISVNFDENLNILTGETGAGKSLIIDAIGCICGNRVSKELIRTGEEVAFIEACFFEKNENIILAREIYQNGRNICKINGKMATLAELKDTASKLIDIHGQHDSQSLLDPKSHIEMLDGFAGVVLYKLKEEYKEVLDKYRDVNHKLKKNYGDENERARRIDLLNYQINEIESANLKENEEDELLSRRKILMNSEKISSSLNSSYDILSNKALDDIEEVIKSLHAISSYNEKYESVLNTISDAYYNLEDAKENLNEYLYEVDFDEDEQAKIEERLDIIQNMKRKYGKNVEDVISFYNKIIEEKKFLENSEDVINKLKNEEQELINQLNKISDKISSIRKECAKKIESLINKQFSDLEMGKAYIEFDFTKSELFLENGTDEVQILICTNVGDELKPLSKIASGGELSRVMLAIKTVLGDYDSIPTMIFDEIDTGISGEAGKKVAEKLKLISKSHQIICVTHLPSIVAQGTTNLFIDKTVKNGTTKTKIKKLNEDETIKEIARIISGKNITEAVLLHAQELRKAVA